MPAKGLNVIQADMKDIFSYYATERFDAIIYNDILCYVNGAETDDIIKRFHELLKPKGVVIATVPALALFRGIHDLSVGIQRRFSKKDIRIIFNDALFELLRASYGHFFYRRLFFACAHGSV